MEWPRGEATACKAVYTGSNPVSTSARAKVKRAIGAAGARFLDTEEVTGSIPVSPTLLAPGAEPPGRPAIYGSRRPGFFPAVFSFSEGFAI